MRKIAIVCLAAAAIGSACSSTGPGGSSAGSAPSPVTEGSPPAATPVSGGSITFADTAGGANFQKFFGQILPNASKDLGIDIQYVPGAGGELQTKLEAQKGAEADVALVLLKPDVLGNMLKAGLEFEALSPDHTAQITNLSLIDPKDLTEAFGVATNGRATPFWRDQFGILYDSAKIPNPPKSWQEFFDRRAEWAGHIGMIRPDAKSGGGRLMLRDFLIGAGVDFSKSFADLQASTEWKDGLEKFRQFATAMYQPLASEPTVLFQQFKTGDVWISEYAIDFTLWSRDQGLLPGTIKAAVFDSGMYGGAAYLAVPANAPADKKELAYRVIDWLLSEKTQVQMQTQMWEYMAINKFDAVPAATWDTIPRWEDIQSKRIPLTNLDAFNWLKETGMTFAGGQ
jgi:putative spermidine/putrescine transport system substrate-binding protein